MDIEQEIDKILEEQNISSHMKTQAELMQRVTEIVGEVVPLILQLAVKIAREEEAVRLGRAKVCRSFLRKGSRSCKKGHENTDCLECMDYEPKLSWWRRRLHEMS